MRFYYVSLFSLILLGLIYVFGTMFLVWLGKTLRKRWDGAWKLMVPLFALLYIGPIAEEPWIAWNFGQLCKKDAGIFVYKTVEVDGFYNGTGATLDLVRPGNYKFIEADDEDGKGAKRLEFGDEKWRRAAIARYEQQNPGKSAADQKYIRVDMEEKTQALVYPTQGDSWRITKLEQPTARYHYKELASHLPVSHQVKKFERVVVDQQTQDVLGRYLIYYRGTPWFFIGLDSPTIPCAESRDSWTEGRSMLVWQSVLLPKK
jgi:hypothetical protein